MLRAAGVTPPKSSLPPPGSGYDEGKKPLGRIDDAWARWAIRAVRGSGSPHEIYRRAKRKPCTSSPVFDGDEVQGFADPNSNEVWKVEP
jgi:hypothetical protein